MRKFVLVYIAAIFFLLLLNNSKAYNLLNFTGSTPKELLTTANAIDQIKGRYFNNSWFVTYTFYDPLNDKGNYISRWYKDYSIEQKDWDLVFGTPSAATYIDWAINTNYLDSLNDNKIIYLTSAGVGATCKILNMTYELKNNTLATDAGCAGTFSISITDNMVYIKQIGNSVYYGDIKSTINGGLSFGSNGTLTLSPSFSSFMGNNTIRFVYVPITNEYWLFYPDQNSILQMSRYDTSFNYINTYVVTGSGELPSDYYFSGLKIYPDYDVIYNTKYGYNVYVAAHLFGNNTIRITAFDVISTKQANDLVTVIFQDINLTQNDPLVNATVNITALSLDYNAASDHFNIFYAYNSTLTGGSVRVLEESSACQYSTWQNTSECVGSNRKQIRTTNNLVNCNAIIQFIDAPDFCLTGQYGNQTQIVYTPVTKCGTPCEDSLRDPKVDPTSKCIASVEIPSNCTGNITVKATLSPYTELTSGIAILESFTYTLCSSNTDCVTGSDACITHDETYLATNGNYTPGQTATGQFEISDAFNCKTGFLKSAWKFYKVTGSICYTCSIPCGSPQCQRVGIKDYAVPYDTLCNPKSSCINDDSCYCQYGCENGICKTSTQAKEEKEGEDIGTGLGTPIKQVFGWGLTGLDVAFGSNQETKILGATIITIGFGVGVAAIIKKNALMSVLGFLATSLTLSLFFAFRGWYPWWLVVLVDIPVAMFIVFMVTGKKSA
jgi:hypothetical protein